MEQKNRKTEPVYIVALVILILFGVSFIPATKVAGVKLKKVDILENLKQDDETKKKSDYEYKYEPQEETEDEYDFDLGKADQEFKVNEASLFSGISGLFSAEADANNVALDKPQTKDQRITGNVAQLKYFFDALSNAKNNIARIAHFGDSIIGGDLITMDFRQNLQEKFGGDAVGLMDITSKDIKFRMTTEHSFSDDWKSADNIRNFRKYPLGISGTVHIPEAGSWVEYKTTAHYPYLEGYKTVRVIYSHAKPSAIKYSFDGGAAKEMPLKEGEDIQEAVIMAPGTAKQVRIEFPEKEQAYVYSVSLENGKGVYVDNLSFQGQSGEKLIKIPSESIKAFDDLLDYNLVIFQFGLNVIDKIEKDPQQYEKDMVEVINHFKKSMPNTSFLLIGVNDKGFKSGAKITTDPSTLTLLAVQQAIVEKTDIAFWNLYEAMGGKESMGNWVHANPPLASSDYTHFNDKGAKLVSEMMSDAIIGAYNAYQKAVKNNR